MILKQFARGFDAIFDGDEAKVDAENDKLIQEFLAELTDNRLYDCGCDLNYEAIYPPNFEDAFQNQRKLQKM